MQRSFAVLIAVFSAAIVPAHAADPNHVHQLLQQRQCSRCDLADTDLVQADLRDADLSQASLQRANPVASTWMGPNFSRLTSVSQV